MLCAAASKTKSVRRGVKEVVKAVRKGEKGVCVIAGDISPIDVISHLPVLCEDNSVPYIFVPSKEALGTAGQTKRPTSCVLIKVSKDEDAKASPPETRDPSVPVPGRFSAHAAPSLCCPAASRPGAPRRLPARSK